MLIEVSGKTISNCGKVYIIAEAGVNHNGSVDSAIRLVDAAKSAAADAVKFQLFSIRRLLAPKQPPSHREPLASLQLSVSQIKTIKQHCAMKGISFLCTPFDISSADALNSMSVSAFKVGSGDITFTPLLARLAAYKKPVFLSTGMSSLAEIETALNILGETPVVLMHCVSQYPAAYNTLNLNTIKTLKLAFRKIVGYSDHSPGLEAPLAAVALGYKVIEKHLTLDRNMEGPDHRSSLEPGEFLRMVEGIRRVESALGSSRKTPAAGEEKMKNEARRSVYITKKLPCGHILTEDDLICLRPAAGIDAADWTHLIAKKLRNNMEKGAPLHWGDLERGGRS